MFSSKDNKIIIFNYIVFQVSEINLQTTKKFWKFQLKIIKEIIYI